MDEITAVLAMRDGEWFGAQAVLDAASAELRLNPNSFMFRYRVRVGNEQPVLLVKIPRKPAHQSINEALQNDSLRAHTRVYFDIMLATRRAFDRAQNSQCFAIRPLEYFEAWNAIAMIEAQGHLKNAARWLRIFHERIGDLIVEDYPRAEIESHVDSLLADLSKHSRGKVNSASIRTSLLAAVSEGWRVPVARTHDDYHYSNVPLSPDGRACGLDARRRSRCNPIYADLATLLLNPVTRIASILTGGLLLSLKFFAQFRQSILDGYFAGEPHDDSILDFYCAIVMIDKWMINERRFSTGASGFAGRWVRWYFSALLRRYLVFSSSKFVTLEATG